jgi:hypothetical protein
VLRERLVSSISYVVTSCVAIFRVEKTISDFSVSALKFISIIYDKRPYGFIQTIVASTRKVEIDISQGAGE